MVVKYREKKNQESVRWWWRWCRMSGGNEQGLGQRWVRMSGGRGGGTGWRV